MAVAFCSSAFNSPLTLRIFSTLILKSALCVTTPLLAHFPAVLTGVYSLKQYGPCPSCPNFFSPASQKSSALAKLISLLSLNIPRDWQPLPAGQIWLVTPIFVSEGSLEHSQWTFVYMLSWLLSRLVAELSSCDRGHLAPKAWNLDYLALCSVCRPRSAFQTLSRS